MIKKLRVPKRISITKAELDQLADDYKFDEAVGMPNAIFSIMTFIEDGYEVIKAATVLNKWIDKRERLAEANVLDKDALEEIEYEFRRKNYFWEDTADSFDDEIAGIQYQLGPKKVAKAVDELLELRDNGSALYKSLKVELKQKVKETIKQNVKESLQREMEAEQMLQEEHARLLLQRNKEADEISDALREKHAAKESLLNWDYSEASHQHSSHTKYATGWIYILSNKMMPKTFKIGFTSVGPAERAHQVTAEMKLPVPFEVFASFRTKNPFAVEQCVHEELSSYLQGREFFSGPPELFEEVIKKSIIPLEGAQE